MNREYLNNVKCMEALSAAPSGCGFPSAFCPSLRAGHHAPAAGGRACEQARGLSRR